MNPNFPDGLSGAKLKDGRIGARTQRRDLLLATAQLNQA
jgi:hypothetical protein